MTAENPIYIGALVCSARIAIHKSSVTQPDVTRFLGIFEMGKGKELADLEDLHAVFEWLGWSAPKNSPVAQALDAHFPGAIPGSALASRLTSVLLRDHKITAKNALFGTSICADEINSESGDMADQLRSYFGKVFPMGGIGGAPFAGKTGFAAFSHHVPDGGHVVILFGPHVGISEHGEVGKYHRVGQEHEYVLKVHMRN